MQSLRSTRWLLLALIVFMAAAAQQAFSQIPVGTTRTGTFVWDGMRWIPAEAPPAPAPAPNPIAVAVAEEEAVVADTAPPELPVEVQPPPPSPDLIWTPGYWHFGLNGFYWVPGAWVPAPHPGLVWTPGYWGWTNGRYFFHEGYWGEHVGYYGGVNYGFGFGGAGFAGGEWRGGHFFYNTAVIHVDHNDRRFSGVVFEDHERVQRSIVENPHHLAFAGGPNGIHHDPTPEEARAIKEPHTPPSPVQRQRVEAAKVDKTAYVKANGGHPPAAAKPPATPVPDVKNMPKPEPKAEPAVHPTPTPTPAAHLAATPTPAGRPAATPTPAAHPTSTLAPATHPVSPTPTPAARPA
ncbi:MAG: hypothetical protein WCF54_08935, partial [Terracidiphilus sp.]